jgi:hypothetical protein
VYSACVQCTLTSMRLWRVDTCLILRVRVYMCACVFTVVVCICVELFVTLATHQTFMIGIYMKRVSVWGDNWKYTPNIYVYMYHSLRMHKCLTSISLCIIVSVYMYVCVKTHYNNFLVLLIFMTLFCLQATPISRQINPPFFLSRLILGLPSAIPWSG